MHIVLAPEEMPQLIAAGFFDRNAELLVLSIAGWLDAVQSAAPEAAALCAGCGATFSGAHLPRAFAVALPWARAGGASTTTSGICARCAARAGTLGEIAEIAIKNWRRLYPDAQFAEGGRA